MMKKFKKISAVLGGVLLAGMTFGTAAAATFPAPFVDDGVADVAIVHGTGSGVSSLDQVSANNIQSALAEEMPSTGTQIEIDGEAFKLEKSSVKFHYGNGLADIYSNLDGDELDFLADGEYDEDDVDTEYEQDIDLSNKSLEIFSDRDYENEEATVGFRWSKNDNVLNYTIDFDEDLNFSDMEDTSMPFLGGEYYVLDTTEATKIELLDTADSALVNLGESVTLGGKTVSIEFISGTEVKFIVDGETTPLLDKAESYELNDGSYIVATEVLSSSKDSVTDSVEFSIGSGKLVLEDGEEVELNEEDVDDLEVSLGTTNDDKLSSITIEWNADDDLFLTEANSLLMPGFDAVGLVYGGMNYPSSSEVISVSSGEQLKLEMDNYVLDLMWVNETNGAVNLGTKYETLITAVHGTGADVTYQFTDGSGLNESNNETVTTLGDVLELSVDDRFLVTVIEDDLSEVRTMHYELTSIDVDGDEFTVELDDLIGTNDLTIDQDDLEGGEWIVEEDDFEITLEGFDSSTDADVTKAYLSFEDLLGGAVTYNKAISEEGMVITLPTDGFATGESENLTFHEADDRGDLNQVEAFNVSISHSTDDEDALHVESVTTVSMVEESDDVDVGYVKSALASKVTLDESSDEHEFEVEYYGEEATADVYVTEADSVSTSDGASALGDVLVKDNEVDAVQAKNLVIVGGSCINSAAAEVLGLSENTCGDAFTAATGVGSGQFLIQSVGDAYTDGKIALVVAGYDVADTTNAATYLRTNDVDTTADKKYVGTSATEATLQVE